MSWSVGGSFLNGKGKCRRVPGSVSDARLLHAPNGRVGRFARKFLVVLKSNIYFFEKSLIFLSTCILPQ